MIKITHRSPQPTQETLDLKEALEKLGVEVQIEVFDGYKHIDLEIAKAKLDVEIDGIHHLINPNQILADLNRGYYSHKDGYNTMHIPNEMIHKHLSEISKALAKACKIRESKMRVHLS